MLRQIAEHAHENLSVADVIRPTGLHPNYAMSLFRRSIGHTITHSITRHRLDIALSLLISTEYTVARIVYDSGFGSPSRFYNAFARRFHMHPLAFRRQASKTPRD